ncbi:MAG: hypothetical protein AAGG68_14360 [Bacteroidota bacterium]
MEEYTEQLKKMEDHKLIDLVKNYRQYDYDEELRAVAIGILNDRGITREMLQLTGGLENTTYNHAENLYYSFSKNSKIAFILYGVLLLISIVQSVLGSDMDSPILVISIASWGILIAYLVFLIRSFASQNQFYKTINENYDAEGALLYFFVGMPFYVFMYFYFRNQMKEKMKRIV